MDYFEVPMEAIVPVDDEVMTAEAANSLSADLGGFVVQTAQTQQNERQQSTNHRAVEVQQIHQEGQKIIIVTNEVGEDDDLEGDQQQPSGEVDIGVTLAAPEPVGVSNEENDLPAIDPDFESPFDQFVQDEVVVQADGNTEDYQAEVEVKLEQTNAGDYGSEVIIGDVGGSGDIVQQFTEEQIIQEEVPDEVHAQGHFQVEETVIDGGEITVKDEEMAVAMDLANMANGGHEQQDNSNVYVHSNGEYYVEGNEVDDSYVHHEEYVDTDGSNENTPVFPGIPAQNCAPGEKPRLSYAQMIAEALMNAPDKSLPLAEIYQYISRRYPYYKMETKSWQNAIRHNLTLNPGFIKVPRPGNEGRGNLWCLVEGAEKTIFKRIVRNHYGTNAGVVKTPRVAGQKRKILQPSQQTTYETLEVMGQDEYANVIDDETNRAIQTIQVIEDGGDSSVASVVESHPPTVTVSNSLVAPKPAKMLATNFTKVKNVQTITLQKHVQTNGGQVVFIALPSGSSGGGARIVSAGSIAGGGGPRIVANAAGGASIIEG